jgi:ATP/maltotriose-dependent transcriptional regulator MalT
MAAMVWLANGLVPWCAKEALRAANEAWAAARRPGVDVRSANNGHIAACIGYLACGRREQAERVALAAKDQTAHTRQIQHKIISESNEGILCFIDGRLEDALVMSQRLQDSAKESGVEETAKIASVAAGLRPHIYLGNADNYLKSLLEDPSHSYLAPFFLAHLGRHREATEWLERMLKRRPQITSFEDETPVSVDIPYLESAIIVGHSKTAGLMLRRFSTNTLATTGSFYTTVIARHLGAAAVMLGRLDEGRKHYQEALKVATEMRFRPEIALTRLQLAELLLEHYPEEKSEATAHLDFATKEFREMKMQPSLERALRDKEILKA